MTEVPEISLQFGKGSQLVDSENTSYGEESEEVVTPHPGLRTLH